MPTLGTRPATPAAYKLLHDGCRALAQVEHQGILIDTVYLREKSAEVKDKVSGYAAELRQHEIGRLWTRRSGMKTNLDARDQLAAVLFDEMGLPYPAQYGRQAGGGYKCDEQVLRAVEGPGVAEFVDTYLRHQKMSKLVNTYFNGISRELVKGWLRPSFNLHTTITYRGSCKEPNFQTIPIRDPEMGQYIRRAFIAPDDYVILEADYGAIEVIVAACYHKDPTMIRYIETGYDMHSQMACKCLKLDHPTFAAQLADGNKAAKALRQAIKGLFVFAQFYGSWFKECATSIWNAMATMVTPDGVPVLEHLAAQGITQLGERWERGQQPPRGSFCEHIKGVEDWFWHTTFPKYAQWREQHYKQYLETGGFTTLTGFRSWGPQERNQVINSPVQGSAFHCLLQAIVWMVQDLRRGGWRSRVFGQIHDSALAYVHRDELDDFRPFIHHTMATRLREEWEWIICRLTVEADVTPVGGNWHQKKPLALE